MLLKLEIDYEEMYQKSGLQPKRRPGECIKNLLSGLNCPLRSESHIPDLQESICSQCKLVHQTINSKRP
jgi:hypothetical protein